MWVPDIPPAIRDFEIFAHGLLRDLKRFGFITRSRQTPCILFESCTANETSAGSFKVKVRNAPGRIWRSRFALGDRGRPSIRSAGGFEHSRRFVIEGSLGRSYGCRVANHKVVRYCGGNRFARKENYRPTFILVVGLARISLQLRMLPHTLGLENETTLRDDLVIRLQPLENCIVPVRCRPSCT